MLYPCRIVDSAVIAEKLGSVARLIYALNPMVGMIDVVRLHFFDERGAYCVVSSAVTTANEATLNRPGRWICSCTLPEWILNTCSCTVGVAVTAINSGIPVVFFERDALVFQVTMVGSPEMATR